MEWNRELYGIVGYKDNYLLLFIIIEWATKQLSVTFDMLVLRLRMRKEEISNTIM
jgi:hypothetical protein